MQTSINKSKNRNFAPRFDAAKNKPAPELARFAFTAIPNFGNRNGNSAGVSLNKPSFGSGQSSRSVGLNLRGFLG